MSVKDDFTLMSTLLIPVAIALNVVGGQIAAVLALPIYIDSIGTILAGILAGPWVGLVAGILSNVINGIFQPNFFPFAVVSGVIGLVSGILSRKHMFTTWWKIIISILCVTLVGVVVGSPIVMYVYGGITGNGSTYLTALMLATGKTLFTSVFTSQVFTEIADKGLSIIVAYIIIKAMSDRILVKYPCGEQFLKHKKAAAVEAPVADDGKDA
ncbi:ECF transporter S component [Sediminispirochaeta bajacaliforniensis]|uniref:ECF transporter S component n=1 Tax=Sediminispirochaeta bajacaliforniensis TaxID=148 RepID=UPI0003711145|nr:ECF transporter S component [Sediminispirochaeta bajacaliforniensis]